MSNAREFATDPVAVASLAQAAECLAATPPPLQPWMLIDATLLDPVHFASVLHRCGWRAVHALVATRRRADGACSPHLVALPPAADAIAEGLRRIHRIAPSAPAISWFASRQPVAQLQACCAYLAQGRHAGVSLHCRIGDMRVLPALLAVLSAPQAGRVAQSIVKWQWFDRAGGIGQWQAPAWLGEAAIDTAPALELDGAQVATLLEAAEADGLFVQLLKTAPHLVPRTGRAQFHRHLQRALAEATRRQVVAMADRREFVVLSLRCGEDFHRHPELAGTWQAVAQGRHLTAVMKDWSDRLWMALLPPPA